MFEKKVFNFKSTLNKLQQYSYLNTKCKSIIDIKSLRIVLNPDIKLNPNEFRFCGVPIRIQFYDTHRLDSGIRYNQSSIPTVLLLASNEDKLETYKYLIEKLLNEKKRVLALNFPG
jgi:hypothetical protein